MTKKYNRRLNRFFKNREPEFWFKIISLSIAIILHLALILYLRQARIIIKILPFKRETEIAIAKYPEVNMPRNLQEVINQPPSSDLFPAKTGRTGPGGTGPGIPGRPGLKPGTGTGKPGGTESEESAYTFDLDRYLASGRDKREPGEDFTLTLRGRFRTIGKYNFSLTLPVRPAVPGEGEKGGKELRGDVYRYLGPQGYRQPGKGLRFGPGGKPVPGGTGAVQVPVSPYKYDINPWAEKVVNSIQAKWVLPELSVMPENRTVALLIQVDRDGQILSLEMTTSTANELLDQAVLSAVKLSSPFPPLPPDFPGKVLEFSLVFTYHE